MILELSYVNQQGDLENDKIAVTGKSIHSLLCARNGATKFSFLYDGTHIKHGENVTHLNEQDKSKSNSRKCDSQFEPRSFDHKTVFNIAPNNLIASHGMTQNPTSNPFFPDMNFFSRLYNNHSDCDI